MNQVNAAILGSGNIGTDLLYKALRSKLVNPLWMVGIDPGSEGLARAQSLGLKVSAQGLAGLEPYLASDAVRIVFDATSAAVHAANAARLRAHGVMAIDLTPAAIGPYCVPAVNLAQHISSGELNVNMVSCGGQATIPIVAAVSRIQPVAYAEIVATVASRSAGPGTRKNIDEFTRTTADGIVKIGGAKRGKAIIILNPAEPPLVMRDTVHCLTETSPDTRRIAASIEEMIVSVQKYVPGYSLKNGPVFDGSRVSVFLEVAGRGDYLPPYAGNLDIMTAAALRTAELVAERLITVDSRHRQPGQQS
jgi:acetaldehyde/propanal dehydrogenase